ncbi:MAG: hypothetical protein AB7I50_23630 [Vicinamibacterales bacterium]
MAFADGVAEHVGVIDHRFPVIDPERSIVFGLTMTETETLGFVH